MKILEVNPHNSKIIQEFIPNNYKWISHDEDYMNISYDEIKNNNYSLNYKKYVKEEIKVNNGFKLVKLGDILKWKPKTKHSAKNGLNEGLYRFYTSSDKIKYVNYLDFNNDLCLIIGNGGKGCIYLDKVFSVSDHMFVLYSNDNNITTYIYYYLKNNWETFVNKCFNGSTIGHISKETLNNYEIILPENINLIKLYLNILEPCNEILQNLQNLQNQKEKLICNMINYLITIGKKDIDYDEYILNDICNFKKGKFHTKHMLNNGDFPFYNAGFNNPIGTHNEYCFDGEKYIIFIKSGCNSLNSGLALPILCKGKIAAVTDVIKIDIKLNNYNDYMYYYLKLIRQDIMNNSNFTISLGHVDMDYFKNLKVKILKPHILKKYNLYEEFELIDNLKNSYQNTINHQINTTKQMMKLVFDENIKKETNVDC